MTSSHFEQLQTRGVTKLTWNAIIFTLSKGFGFYYN